MKKFGHYEVTAELGRGGMGVVYKGWDPSLNRKVAIKALGEHLLNDNDLKERFTREAKATAALNDANVIQIYFIGEEQGQPYFAMEFIEGESLDDILKGGKALSIAHAKNLLKQASSGMAAAHKLDLVHRDIKPANMMLTTEGTLKIVDFGIARTREYGDKLTNTGEFVGTPGYLSPEVCIGQEVDLRSDIFSLGIVFYEMLAGKVPFENDSPLGLMLEVVQADIPDIRKLNSKVDKKTSFILEKMIAKSPEDRYQTCEHIIRDLGNVIDNQSLEDIKSGITNAPVSKVKKSNVSEQITLQAGQAITQPNLTIQPQAKKSKKTGLMAASVFGLLLAAGAAGYYGGYLPFSPKNQSQGLQQPLSLADNTESNETLVADNTDTANNSEKELQATQPKAQSEVPSEIASKTQMQVTEMAANSTPTDLSQPEISSETLPPNQTETSAQQTTQNSLELASSQPSSEGFSDTSTEMPAEKTSNTQVISQDNSRLIASLDKQKVNQVVADKVATRLNNSAQDLNPERASKVVENVQSRVQKRATNPSAHVSRIQSQVDKISQQPIRLNKGVVVISLGDPAIANPVEKFIESQLKKEGIKVMNESFISGMNQALSHDFDMAEVRNLIRRNGGQALVIANVNHIGTQELNYAGRTSTLVNAQLDIDSYDIGTGEMIGSGFGSNINYTSLNATQEATDAVSQYSEELKSLLKEKI